ncbi:MULTISPECIES: hypothetical protein [unclassified Pseudarthrobacter]|uniref:hypothetical protein n=1 Tax=unclassified Pseudarthrobacter TaxID=2647000 RepID=UPI003077BC5D
MTTDKVNPVGTKDEPFRRALNRPYYYGYARTGKTVYAYTKQEWGMGAGSGGGDHKLIRSFYFSLLATALIFLPASLACLVFGLLALFKMPLMTLVMVFFGLIFGLGVLQGYFNVQEEWRGRKARKLKGLPKPWWQAADDHAYEWFLTHPDSRIQMTLDYFPHSAKLRRQEAAR